MPAYAQRSTIQEAARSSICQLLQGALARFSSRCKILRWWSLKATLAAGNWDQIMRPEELLDAVEKNQGSQHRFHSTLETLTELEIFCLLLWSNLKPHLLAMFLLHLLHLLLRFLFEDWLAKGHAGAATWTRFSIPIQWPQTVTVRQISS